MKLLVLLLASFAFSGNVLAEGVCSATEPGYEAYCEGLPNKYSCNFQSQCKWANSGFGACSASEDGFEAFCGSIPNEFSCEFHDECFWVDPN